MSTIENKLNYLSDTKTAIKDAISAKGINITAEDTFRSYADKITQISGGNSKIIFPDHIKFGWNEVAEFTTNKYDFSQIKDGKYLFRESLIQYAPQLNGIIGSASRMFQDCANLLEANYYIGKPNNLGNMFYNCSNLKKIQSLDFTNANDCYQMFYGCSKLTYLNIINLGKGNIPSNRALELHQCVNWGNNNLASSQGITGAFDSLFNSLYTNSYNRKAAGLPVVTIKLASAVLNRLTWPQRDSIQKKGYTLVAA